MLSKFQPQPLFMQYTMNVRNYSSLYSKVANLLVLKLKTMASYQLQKEEVLASWKVYKKGINFSKF